MLIKPVPFEWRKPIESWAKHLRVRDLAPTSIATRTDHLRRCARTIGVASPWDVDQDDLESWLGEHAKWKTETRRSMNFSLRSFYGWAHARGKVPHNPAANLPVVKASSPSPRPAPDVAYEEALERATWRERIMLRLAAEAGLRRAEVAVVHSDDLFRDLDGWSLMTHGKGRRTRITPLHSDLARELIAYLHHHVEGRGYAFPGAVDGHISPQWVGILISRLLPPPHTMHSLRHRYATHVQYVGRDLSLTQHLLGHASPSTTMRYVDVMLDGVRDVLTSAATLRLSDANGRQMSASHTAELPLIPDEDMLNTLADALAARLTAAGGNLPGLPSHPDRPAHAHLSTPSTAHSRSRTGGGAAPRDPVRSAQGRD